MALQFNGLGSLLRFRSFSFYSVVPIKKRSKGVWRGWVFRPGVSACFQRFLCPAVGASTANCCILGCAPFGPHIDRTLIAARTTRDCTQRAISPPRHNSLPPPLRPAGTPEFPADMPTRKRFHSCCVSLVLFLLFFFVFLHPGIDLNLVNLDSFVGLDLDLILSYS